VGRGRVRTCGRRRIAALIATYTVVPEPDELFYVWPHPLRQQFVQSRIHLQIGPARNSGGNLKRWRRIPQRSCDTVYQVPSRQEEVCTCPSLPWQFGRSWPCLDETKSLRMSEPDHQQIHPDAPIVQFLGGHQVEHLDASPMLRESRLPPIAVRSCRRHVFSVGIP